jgi:RHS repeat-associated protein
MSSTNGVWATNSWSNSFAYDGMMRKRIERDYIWQSGSWQETSETHFIYDGNAVIEERNAGNQPLVNYTLGVGGLLARTIDQQELPGTISPTNAFYHADGNGNITALMYPSGQLAAKYLYDPFGNMLAMSGPLASFNRYRFSSQEWNDSAGLYYFGRRFYDPILQRWINRDPIEEQGGLNLYGFVGNDAVNWVDLLGLSPTPNQLTDHHDFPKRFEYQFADMGINVHDKQNLTTLPWFAHQGLGKDYEDEWDEFFDQPRTAADVPAARQLLKDLQNSPRYSDIYALGQPATKNYEGYEDIQAYINQRATFPAIRGRFGSSIAIIGLIGIFASSDSTANAIEADAIMYAVDSQSGTPDGSAWAYVDLLAMRSNMNQLAPFAGDVAMAEILATEGCHKQN